MTALDTVLLVGLVVHVLIAAVLVGAYRRVGQAWFVFLAVALAVWPVVAACCEHITRGLVLRMLAGERIPILTAITEDVGWPPGYLRVVVRDVRTLVGAVLSLIGLWCLARALRRTNVPVSHGTPGD